jgi:hypothetical protein
VDSSTLPPDILISSTNSFFLHQVSLDLQSDQLKILIASRNRDIPLVVKMEKGASQKALSLLFDYVSKLNVANIVVINE